MDLLLARRLDENSASYDSSLFNKLAKLGRDYCRAGLSTLEYYTPCFDVSNDLLNCFAAGTRTEFEKRDKGDPQNFIHPMAATEMWTLATFVSQILFGGETTRRVEPRNPDDEKKADIVNELLAWNDAQQPTYSQGFHWCLDAIVQNRGVMYDRWKDMWEVTLEPVEYELPWEQPLDPVTKKPAIDPETGRKYRKPRNYEAEKAVRFRKVRKKVGGFVKIDLISPWDFICDATIPIDRFQESRFAGHRVTIPWNELKKRSELPPDDYNYVLPAVVEKLKNAHGKKAMSIASKSATSVSRSYYERTRRQQPAVTVTGSDKINKEDGGVIECFCLQMRARPKTYDIFDDEEEEIIEILIAGETDLLSVNVLTSKHDQYSYSVGEARPNIHQQFSPSWAMIIQGPSAYLNYLQNRHKESLARTSGNIFVGDAAMIDFDAFLNAGAEGKDGLIIPLTEAGAASGKPLNQMIMQIPVVDTTAKFYDEMDYWQRTAEIATGAHASIQGETEDPSQTLGQFDQVQQMATGRISTIARLLSAGPLCEQTRRIVSNLQQFLEPTTVIRVIGESDDYDPDKPQEKFLTVIRDRNLLDPEDPEQAALLASEMPDIQGSFDVTPHDGAMPGTNSKKVAALSRAVEAWSANPALQICFDSTIPGNIDPRKLFFKLLHASDFPIGSLVVSREQAQKNLQERMLASGMGQSLPPGQGSPVAPPVDPATGMPSASVIPAIPPATPA